MNRTEESSSDRDFMLNLRKQTIGVLLGAFAGLAIATSSAAATNSIQLEPPLFPTPTNSEKSHEGFTSPEEAVKAISLPPGFKATLFAGEPDVQQPIAIATDDRGRLWVVENYTYSETETSFDSKLRDRIIILEDTNHDGHFDKRTVFWDKGERVTSVAIGFGGVWVLAAPKLLFIPDRNGDDIPDGEAEVVLDGWNADKIHHNIVNGLVWGPDGWLYGRQGILATSLVGRPGTPESQRMAINCGIWRFHPTKKIIEAVAWGTTNPWGMDFDDYGEGFFINTVIGHLWHVIPGAHYKRMYGQDFNRFTYDLIDQHADHYHWDTGRKWTETRDNKGSNDTLGGGHAHSGLMIYLGGNWPDKYRDSVFTVNLHGYRLNNDILERSGAGYVGKHGQDFLKTSDKWFRGIDLIYGNDGGVFLADWSDTGECHEADGVHRTSGRIYKIVNGDCPAPKVSDVAKLSDSELVQLQLEKNDWYVRHARRVLQERAAAGNKMDKANDGLKKLFEKNPDVTRKLRAMWALRATGGAGEKWLTDQLKHPEEHVRAWAIRFLTESQPVSEDVVQHLNRVAKNEKSPYVRLALASALQRIPVASRLAIATALAMHGEDANDHDLPLMTWYGLEPVVGSDPLKTISLSSEARISTLRRFIARRISEDIEKRTDSVDALVENAVRAKDEEVRLNILQGMSQALQGWRKAYLPERWSDLQAALEKSSNPEVKNLLLDLSLTFGDPRAFAGLKEIVLDESKDKMARRAALQKLIDNKSDSLPTFLEALLTNKILAPVAARGLAVYDRPNTAQQILNRFDDVAPEDRTEVMGTLVSRPTYARVLLKAVADGKIARREISAYHARQIRSFNDKGLNKELTEVWGEVRSNGEDKKAAIAKYKTMLTSDRIKKADPSKGRELFSKTCALCHTLYGEGAKIGPDLTGSGRSNLDYLLENIIDPSAIVGADFKMVVVSTKDGRVLNGILSAKTDKTITVQSIGEQTVLERSEITEMKDSSTSLMPEGLLEGLDESQIANLSSYLMSPQQVPLPKQSP